MLKKGIIAACLFSSLFLINSGKALATSSDPSIEICTALLSQGVKDVHNVYRDEFHFKELKNLLQNHQFDSYIEMSSWAAKAGVDILLLEDVIGIDAEAKADNKKFQQKLSIFKSETFESVRSRSKYIDMDSRINTALLGVYQDCEKNYFNAALNNLKQIVIVESQNPPDSFLLKITAYKPPAVAKGLRIKTIEPAADILCSENKKRVKLPKDYDSAEILLSCTKPIDKEVKIAVSTDAGISDKITVPAQKNENEELRKELANLNNWLNKLTLPLGTIIPFSGTLAEAEAQTRNGWWVCDGRTVSDPLANSYYGKQTPNLTEKFLKASTRANDTGGNKEINIPNQTITSYTTGQWSPSGIKAAPETIVHSEQTWPIGNPIQSAGTYTGGTFSTIPPFYSVIYLIKIK